MKNFVISILFLFCLSCTNHDDLNFKINKQINTKALGLENQLIEKFASLSLECIDKTYPYKPSIVLYSKQDLEEPKERHPIFYGCYDWHSAVHGHWAMVKLLNQNPDFKLRSQIVLKLKKHFTKSNFEKEARYFEKPTTDTFERPYGMGWFLRLVSELDKSKDPQFKQWRENAKPLEEIIVKKVNLYFDTFRYPNRVGTHGNSAFSMDHMWDYAEQVNDQKLKKNLHKFALEWFEQDKECPIHLEPSGGDFVSPCLAVGHLMAKVMSQEAFVKWFDQYFPSIKEKRNQDFFFPPITKDIKDPQAGHLVGLTFQKAWSFKTIVAKLPKSHKLRKPFSSSQQLHLQSGVSQMFDSGYGGTHWLASFAIYAYFDE